MNFFVRELAAGMEVESMMNEAGQLAGLIRYHINPTTGESCASYVCFTPTDEERTNGTNVHTLVSLDPLTVEPSCKCRACGSHGFIRNGKWVPA